MSRPFKVGQKVRCILASVVGFFGCPGETYTVARISTDGAVVLLEDPFARTLEPHRFEAIPRPCTCFVGSSCCTGEPCDGNHPGAQQPLGSLQVHAPGPPTPPFSMSSLGSILTSTDQAIRMAKDAARVLFEAGFSGELRLDHGSLRVAPQ